MADWPVYEPDPALMAEVVGYMDECLGCGGLGEAEGLFRLPLLRAALARDARVAEIMGDFECDPYDYSFTAENIAIGLIEPMYPVTTPEPSSTFSLDLSLGERTQVHGWPPVPDVYEAEVADRVRQQQARNRLASIREIAAARNARLGLHDDPSDDAEDDGEIVQRLGVLRIIESDED